MATDAVLCLVILWRKRNGKIEDKVLSEIDMTKPSEYTVFIGII